MSWGRLRSAVRVAVGFAVAAWLFVLVMTPAAASSTVNLTQDLPSAPVQVAVGDVINLALPPVIDTAPPGYDGGGPHKYPLPYSSDSGVLPFVSGTYDADGTLHAQFLAAKAGSATISVSLPGAVFCKTSSTTTSSATSTASTSSVTTSSSTSTSPSPSPTPINQCIASDPIPPQTVTVNVSTSGVLGVSTPATGSAGSPTAGLGLALLGALVSGGALAALLGELHRRRG